MIDCIALTLTCVRVRIPLLAAYALASLQPRTSCAPLDNAADCSALLALYNATGSKLDWKVDGTTSMCSWSGVTCASARVKRLELTGNGLTGTIPPAMGSLSELAGLALDLNDISGSLPTQLGRLSSLKSLFLYFNDFSGTIPPQLALPSATYLSMGYNYLSGTIPSSLVQMPSL
jgi:Leucine-rich repeat (LRR) protein